MRFQLTEAAVVHDQVFPAWTVFGARPAVFTQLKQLPQWYDQALPPGWATDPPPYVVPLDDEAKTALKNANDRLRKTLEHSSVVGSVPGIGHPNNLR